MADQRRLARLPEPELELALLDLAGALAWPAPSAPAGAAGATDDAAARARRRIVAAGVRPARRSSWIPSLGRRSVRSSLVLAAAAFLFVAALAAAIGFGLPGIRFTVISSPTPTALPTPTPSQSPAPSRTPGPPGFDLGLGDPFPPERARTAVSFPVRMPPETLGPPASAWFLDGRLSVVWPSGPDLPPLDESGLGLVLTELQGDVDAGYFEKVIEPGTKIETVKVDGVTGYWISGRPHEIIYVDPHGNPVFDSRTVVGNTLLWARDGITYRLESALDRDAAIALAGSLR
jgi:hypothetical protein